MEKDQLMKEFKEFIDAKYPDKKEEAPKEPETPKEEVKDSSIEELEKLRKELEANTKALAEKDSEIQKLKDSTMGSNSKDETPAKREIKFTPIDKI